MLRLLFASSSILTLLLLCICISSSTLLHSIHADPALSFIDGIPIAPTASCTGGQSDQPRIGAYQDCLYDELWYLVCDNNIYAYNEISQNYTTLLASHDDIHSFGQAKSCREREMLYFTASSWFYALNTSLEIGSNFRVISDQLSPMNLIVPYYQPMIAVSSSDPSFSSDIDLLYLNCGVYATFECDTMVYNITSGQLATFFFEPGPIAWYNFVWMTIAYPSASTPLASRLPLAVLTDPMNGIFTAPLPLLNSTHFHSLVSITQCPTPVFAILLDYEVVAVCDRSLVLFNVTQNGTMAQPGNGTILVASTPECTISRPAIVWNDATQSLYVPCSQSIENSIIVQWRSTSATNPIVTPLLPDICLAMLWITIARDDSSLWLRCESAFFRTDGRSMSIVTNPIVRQCIVAGELWTLQSTGISYVGCESFPTGTTFLTFHGLHDAATIYNYSECSGVGLIQIDQLNSKMYLVCAYRFLATASLIRLTIRPSDGAILEKEKLLSSIEVAAISFTSRHGLYLLDINATNWRYDEETRQLQHVEIIANISTSTGWQIEEMHYLVNRNTTNMNSTASFVSSLSLSSSTTVTTSSQDLSILLTIDNQLLLVNSTNPLLLEAIYIWQSSFDQILVDVVRWIVYGIVDDGMVTIDLTLDQSKWNGTITPLPFDDPANEASVTLWVYDPLRRRIILAIETQPLVPDTMWIIDCVTFTVKQMIAPTSRALPMVYGLSLIENTGTLIVSLTNDQHWTSQIVKLTDKWTCIEGTQWSESGRCEECGIGTARGPVAYEDAMLAIPQCLPCAQGSIAPLTGTAVCTICDVGFFANSAIGEVCSPCGLGYYANQSGSAECQPCAAGRYSKSTMASECSDCEIGRYSSSPASAGCNFCEPGRNQSSRGQTSCSPCVAGSYTPDIEYAECVACEPGSYSDRLGASACFPCSIGSASNTTGLAIPCEKCPAGFESINASGIACTPCRFGWYSQAGSFCQQCPPGTYSDIIGQSCIPCTGVDQLGLTCTNGWADCKPGWFPYQEFDIDKNWTIWKTTKCPPGYCLGLGLSTSFVDFCEPPRLPYSTNWLCGRCYPDHLPWSGECVSCQGINWGLSLLVLLLGFFIVAFILRSNSAAGPLTILVFFVQIAAIELGPVSTRIDWIQFANLGAHSTRDCIAPLTPVEQKIFTLFIPLILGSILAFIAGIHYSIRTIQNHFRKIKPLFLRLIYAQTRDFQIDRYIGTMMAILIFGYTQVTATVVQSLHCVEVAPGVTLLFNTPAIDCSSSEYRHHLLPFAYIWLIFYVIGFPLAMFIFLQKNKRMIEAIGGRDLNEIRTERAATQRSGSDTINQNQYDHEHTHIIPDTLQVSDTTLTLMIQFDLRWTHFFRPYRVTTWYWQPIAMLRRFVFALISVLMLQSPTYKYVLFSGVSLLSLVMHSSASPFRTEKLNALESISYVLLMYVSFVLISRDPPYSIGVEVLLFILVVPFGASLIVITLKASYLKLKNRILTTLENVIRQQKDDEVKETQQDEEKATAVASSLSFQSLPPHASSTATDPLLSSNSSSSYS